MSGGEQAPFRSGLVTIVGRPNVGKSSLVNRILGRKVSIVSGHPGTTRTEVRGVLDTPCSQVVFVDTPGLHRPRSALGRRLNDAARAAAAGVDVVVVVLDAAAGVGRGDAVVASMAGRDAVVALNKVDLLAPGEVLRQLAKAGELGLSEYFPISAGTGEGVPALVEALVGHLPEGPRLYPQGSLAGMPEADWVAELVREQLLAIVRDELPHQVACVVTEWDWPRVRCEIVVERESQRGIVIGKGGRNLKAVGTAARAQMAPGAYLELFVRVERDWQHRPDSLQRLGL